MMTQGNIKTNLGKSKRVLLYKKNDKNRRHNNDLKSFFSNEPNFAVPKNITNKNTNFLQKASNNLDTKNDVANNQNLPMDYKAFYNSEMKEIQQSVSPLLDQKIEKNSNSKKFEFDNNALKGSTFIETTNKSNDNIFKRRTKKKTEDINQINSDETDTNADITYHTLFKFHNIIKKNKEENNSRNLKEEEQLTQTINENESEDKIHLITDSNTKEEKENIPEPENRVSNASIVNVAPSVTDKNEKPNVKTKDKEVSKPDKTPNPELIIPSVESRDKELQTYKKVSGGGDGSAPGKKVTADISMPETKIVLSPKEDKRIGGVSAVAGRVASKQATLTPADQIVENSRKAVDEPQEETKGKAKQVLLNKIQEPPDPSIVALCGKIREDIRKKRPEDEDDLTKTNLDEPAKAAGNALDQNVKKDTDSVKQNYDKVNDNPQGKPEQVAAPLKTPTESIKTESLNANRAVPDKVPEENISLDKDVSDNKQKIQNAGMNSPTASLVEDGPIKEAKDAQGNLEQTAKEDPVEVRKKQESALENANQAMIELQNQAILSLQSSRKTAAQKTGKKQKEMVQSEEQLRQQISKDANEIFEKARKKVNDLLKPLPEIANTLWREGKNIATRDFKAELKSVQDWIDKRHSGVGGFFVKGWDAVTGLPNSVIKSYDKAEKKFGDKICETILIISSQVNTVVKSCKTIITDAETDIKKLFDNLPDGLKKWASEEQGKFQSRLDDLKTQTETAKKDFTKQLADDAKSTIKEARLEIQAMRKKAVGLIGLIADAINAFIDDPLKFIINGLLSLLGISPPSFWSMINKIAAAIVHIANDPVSFGKNLLSAISLGFQKFFDNIWKHLYNGLFDWLFSKLKDTGIQKPTSFNLTSIAAFFLQLMGITWVNIRKMIVKNVGEKNVAMVEKAWELLSVFIKKGINGLVDLVKEKLNPETFIDTIKTTAIDFIQSALVKQVAKLIALLFIPGGVILKAIEAIYRVIKWIFENAAKIFTLIETIVNGIADLIAGKISGMAVAIENGLAKLLGPVIGFLADFLGLGDLPEKVASAVKALQKKVLEVVDKVIEAVVTTVKKLSLKVVDTGKKIIAKFKEWWKMEKKFKAKNGEDHKMYFHGHDDDGEMMIASKPKKINDFISIRETENAKEDNVEKKKHVDTFITKAKGSFLKLKGEKQNRNKKFKEYKTKIDNPENTEDLKPLESKITEIDNSIVTLINRIADEVSEIYPSKDIKESTMPKFGQLVDGFGSQVTIERLTNKVPPGGSPANSSLFNPQYKALNMRRFDENGSFFYVRGHLLNHNLGGPGDLWANLVPMSTNFNTQTMEKEVESDMKKRVLGQDNDGVLWDVEISTAGQRTENENNLLDQIKNRKLNNNSLDSKEKRNEEAEKKEIIIRSESKIPKGVIVSYRYGKYKKGTNEEEVHGTFGPKKLPNDINNNTIEKYHVTK